MSDSENIEDPKSVVFGLSRSSEGFREAFEKNEKEKNGQRNSHMF